MRLVGRCFDVGQGVVVAVIAERGAMAWGIDVGLLVLADPEGACVAAVGATVWMPREEVMARLRREGWARVP